MRAILVAGLAFGDEGKGAMTDYLVRRHQSKLVVRYNGGPQAAHNVVTDEGVHHTFAQFGSGTLAGAKTFLSKYMLVEPFALMSEAKVLETKGVAKPLQSLIVDPKCEVITPFDWLANRMIEDSRGFGRHGSVGFGVGEARERQLAGVRLAVEDLRYAHTTCGKLQANQERSLEKIKGLKHDLYQELINTSPLLLASKYRSFYDSLEIRSWEDLSDIPPVTIFEGAQGVLLDEEHGDAPHSSWTDCTFGNAFKLLDQMFPTRVEATTIGVVRSYYTRHGAGPFPTEVTDSIHNNGRAERHNKRHPCMGEFRIGCFDMPALEYAVKVCGGVDSLAVTHMDVIPGRRIAYSLEGEPTKDSVFLGDRTIAWTDDLVADIERKTKVPVNYLSFGPKARDKYERNVIAKKAAGSN